MILDSLLGSRIVVTGGCGLIGSSLCNVLSHSGADAVISIDPRNDQVAGRLSPEGANFQWLRSSVDSDEAKREIGKADYVFHLAASTEMRWSSEHPMRDFEQGLGVTLSVLESMRAAPPRRFVFCSSSAVYGELASKPVNEDEGPLLPCSTYGAAKLAAEGWISAYARMLGFSALICRLGNIVSGSLDRGALLDIVRQVATTGVVRLLGNGEQGRTYIGADACAEALVHLAVQAPVYLGATVINVSGRGLIRSRELVDIASDVVGRRASTQTTSDAAEGWLGDVPVVNLDVGRLERFGWAPPTSRESVRKAAFDLVHGHQWGMHEPSRY